MNPVTFKKKMHTQVIFLRKSNLNNKRIILQNDLKNNKYTFLPFKFDLRYKISRYKSIN